MSTDEAERVVAAWRRIQSWLRLHAPASYATLQPAATADQLMDFETRISASVAVPPGLKALWMCNNGSGDRVEWGDPEEEFLARQFLPPGDMLYSVQASRFLYGTNLSQELYEPTWIPFGTGVPDGKSGLFVNTTPGEYYGQVGRWNFQDQHLPEGPMLSAFLEDAASQLEEGTWAPEIPDAEDDD